MFGRPVVDGPPRATECATCGYVCCVCALRREHNPECRYRRTVLAELPVAECPNHPGSVACTECASCNCGGVKAAPAARKRRAA
jgi:hypothetical protein